MEQDGSRHRFRWYQIVLLVALLVMLVLIGVRRPWVEPLPGVSIVPSRPVVREADLGPESAYRLLLDATSMPAEEGNPSFLQVWRGGFPYVLVKFQFYPWPQECPVATGLDRPVPSGPWTRAEYEDIKRLARFYEPYVVLLDLALDAPDPQMPTVDSPTYMVNYLSGVRRMGYWLAVSACQRAGIGDGAGSIQDLSRALRLGNLVCRGGELVGHAIGHAGQIAAADAAWVVARQDGVSAPALHEGAQLFLAALADAEPVAEGLRQQLLVAEALVSTASRGPTPDPRLLPPSLSSREWRPVFAAGPLLGSTPRSTAWNVEAYFQHLIALAERPPDGTTVADLAALREQVRLPGQGRWYLMLRIRDPVGLLLAGSLADDAQHTILSALRRDAALRAMAVFLAVRAYEVEHGQPPEDLAQLVPEYLPAIPLDPYDGQPLRYLRRDVPGLPPEAWAVYSIGENGGDDGGTARAVGVVRDAKAKGPDFVWPSQNYR